jgi:GLPGLI family protein
MKLRITTLTLLILLTSSLVMALPPKGFKGVITYKITYAGEDINEQMKAFLPGMLVTKMRGDMSKTVMSMGMGQTIKIKNGEEKSVISLFDMMGQKVGLKSTWEDIQEELAKEPEAEIKYVNEQKEIAGYMCKKAIITLRDESGGKERLIAYYTKELGENPNHWDTRQFQDIEGILLEFQMASPQFTMTFTATSVDKGGVSKKEFDIPEDFEMKSREEIESMFGGI